MAHSFVMAQGKFTHNLLELIRALRRLTEEYPEAPRREGYLGYLVNPNTNSKAELTWMLRMELVGYETASESGRRWLRLAVAELRLNHPDLLDTTDENCLYVFVLDSPEFPS